MSANMENQKRKFAHSLRGVGAAATIRENVLKDLKKESVGVSVTRSPSG
jgi:hypothetical protein